MIISATFIPIPLTISQAKHSQRGRELSSSDDEVNPQEELTSILFLAFLSLTRWRELYNTSKSRTSLPGQKQQEETIQFSVHLLPFPQMVWLASKKILSPKRQVSKAHSWMNESPLTKMEK